MSKTVCNFCKDTGLKPVTLQKSNPSQMFLRKFCNNIRISFGAKLMKGCKSLFLCIYKYQFICQYHLVTEIKSIKLAMTLYLKDIIKVSCFLRNVIPKNRVWTKFCYERKKYFEFRFQLINIIFLSSTQKICPQSDRIRREYLQCGLWV